MDIIEVYNEGNINCPHSLVYSPLSETLIKNGLFFKTKRACELCGRFEMVLENMKHNRVENYYTILDNFRLEMK